MMELFLDYVLPVLVSTICISSLLLVSFGISNIMEKGVEYFFSQEIREVIYGVLGFFVFVFLLGMLLFGLWNIGNGILSSFPP